jgi:GGDEF domain-containing protein
LSYLIDGVVLKITTSIGIAVYPLDGEGCGELVRIADREMYRHKTTVARGGDAAGATSPPVDR